MHTHMYACTYTPIYTYSTQTYTNTCVVCGTRTCVWECVCLCTCMQRSEHDSRCLYCCPIALNHCLPLNQKLSISGRLCKVSYGTCLFAGPQCTAWATTNGCWRLHPRASRLQNKHSYPLNHFPALIFCLYKHRSYRNNNIFHFGKFLNLKIIY